jgi:hypothetical protein
MMALPRMISWLRRGSRRPGTEAAASESPPPVSVAPSEFEQCLHRFESREAFEIHQKERGQQRLQRWRLDQAIAAELAHGPFWFECTIGDHMVGLCPDTPPDPALPFDWREQGACPACGLNARVRFCLELMRLELAGTASPSVYLTEQATRTYAAALHMFPGALGSEFVFDPARIEALQAYIRTITADDRQCLRAEDVTALSFDDAGLDAIGSFEVLEHVPDYRKALAEFARVLKPGGLLVLTAPFLERSAATLVRARIGNDGGVEHIEPPEYHGDPASPDGALCFYHFGWDLADALRQAGFDRVEYVTGWSLSLGLLGTLGAFVARRVPPATA